MAASSMNLNDTERLGLLCTLTCSRLAMMQFGHTGSASLVQLRAAKTWSLFNARIVEWLDIAKLDFLAQEIAEALNPMFNTAKIFEVEAALRQVVKLDMSSTLIVAVYSRCDLALSSFHYKGDV